MWTFFSSHNCYHGIAQSVFDYNRNQNIKFECFTLCMDKKFGSKWFAHTRVNIFRVYLLVNKTFIRADIYSRQKLFTKQTKNILSHSFVVNTMFMGLFLVLLPIYDIVWSRPIHLKSLTGDDSVRCRIRPLLSSLSLFVKGLCPVSWTPVKRRYRKKLATWRAFDV